MMTNVWTTSWYGVHGSTFTSPCNQNITLKNICYERETLQVVTALGLKSDDSKVQDDVLVKTEFHLQAHATKILP